MIRKEFQKRFLSATLCVFFAASVEAASSYRIIPENFLKIGNRWVYQVHVTKEENVVVDVWGTDTWVVTKTENIEGFNTTVVQQTSSSDGHNETNRVYWMVSLGFLTEVQWEEESENSEFERETVRNNNPWEMLPVSVSDTDNNLPVGNGGEYTGVSSEGTWTGEIKHYISYLRQESVTVPAGTFECIVVLIKSEWQDFVNGVKVSEGDTDSILWMNPDVGLIKINEIDRERKVGDQTWLVDEQTAELSSTKVKAMPWIPLLLLDN